MSKDLKKKLEELQKEQENDVELLNQLEKQKNAITNRAVERAGQIKLLKELTEEKKDG